MSRPCSHIRTGWSELLQWCRRWRRWSLWALPAQVARGASRLPSQWPLGPDGMDGFAWLAYSSSWFVGLAVLHRGAPARDGVVRSSGDVLANLQVVAGWQI